MIRAYCYSVVFVVHKYDTKQRVLGGLSAKISYNSLLFLQMICCNQIMSSQGLNVFFTFEDKVIYVAEFPSH